MEELFEKRKRAELVLKQTFITLHVRKPRHLIYPICITTSELNESTELYENCMSFYTDSDKWQNIRHVLFVNGLFVRPFRPFVPNPNSKLSMYKAKYYTRSYVKELFLRHMLVRVRNSLKQYIAQLDEAILQSSTNENYIHQPIEETFSETSKNNWIFRDLYPSTETTKSVCVQISVDKMLEIWPVWDPESTIQTSSAAGAMEIQNFFLHGFSTLVAQQTSLAKAVQRAARPSKKCPG